MAYLDWRSSPLWTGLDPNQQLALMGMMERGPKDKAGAYGVGASVINRAKREKKSIPDLLAEKKSRWGTYQPLSESDQYERAQGYVKDPEFGELTSWMADRQNGLNDDPTKGATHYLAPESTMLALEAKEPGKYKSWRQWTGYQPGKGYQNVTYRDGSHAFTTPDGASYGGNMHPDDWTYGGAEDQRAKLARLQQVNGQGAGLDWLATPEQAIPDTGAPTDAESWQSSPSIDRNAAYDQLLQSLMGRAYPQKQAPEFGQKQFFDALIPAGAAIYEAASRPGASTLGSIGAGGVGFGGAVKGYFDKEKERALSSDEQAMKLQSDLLTLMQGQMNKEEEWKLNAQKYQAEQAAKMRDDERADRSVTNQENRLKWDMSKQPREKTMTPRDLNGMMTNRQSGEVDPEMIDKLIFYGGETYAQDPGGLVILKNRFEELQRKAAADPNGLTESEQAVYEKLKILIGGGDGADEAMVP